MSNIVVDPEDIATETPSSSDSSLVEWVVSNVNEWVEHRDSNYKDKWEEFYRLYRGKFAEKDKTRQSERSKLISPALQQSIESTVAELEEATFGMGAWLDVADDVMDDDKQDMMLIRDLLLEDLDNAGVPREIAKVYLNGAIYGTGIAKILVEMKERKYVAPPQTQFSTRPTTGVEQYVNIGIEAVEPLNFAIDPSARTIEEAMGVAHIVIRPMHTILRKQKAGVYKDVPIHSDEDDDFQFNDQNEDLRHISSKVKVIEYYGLVPRELMPEEVTDEEVFEDFDFDNGNTERARDYEEADLVEAMVTIANESTLLKAVKNPYLLEDRPFVSYQHDTVVNKFWGVGVAEKGYNPQKALDAELRARIDTLALTTHPMMGVDATRLPRGHNIKVRPGKIVLTNGNPNDVLMPFNFGQGVNPSTFHQGGDLERMVQMGTGAMDSATPTSINPRNQTASGMSMMSSQFIKRSKRTMQNVTRQFLTELIKKISHRYMQFAPDRYPATDFKFKVIAGMGIMAREYEQGQLTNLLSIVPPDSPPFAVILKGIFDNSSLQNKTELMQALDQMFQPNPQEIQAQQEAQELQKAQIIKELEKTESEIIENLANAEAKTQKNFLEDRRLDLENLRILIEKDLKEKSIEEKNTSAE